MNPAPFQQLTATPLSAIYPGGWLKTWLQIQNEGLTGHVAASGEPFDRIFWGAYSKLENPDGLSWCPYEQTAYWLDGAISCGHLLRDEALVKKAQCQIDFALGHADEEGYIGHPHFKEGFRWPHTVFFRACIAHHSATGDPSIPQAIRRHYLGHQHSHSHDRDVTNIEIMLWAYTQTGDSALLDIARDAFEENSKNEADRDYSLPSLLSDRRSTEHGVSFNEMAKLGAILYAHTGETRYLDASLNGYRKLDRDQMLVSGVPSSSEHLRGKDPLDSHETCDIADYTWSVGHLLRVTGDACWADRIERACFNAAAGAITPDFRALQYFSCPNQVVSTCCSNHNLFFCGAPWMAYRPNPGTACCAGNVHRILPNFASMVWMRNRSGGLVCALYAPSTYRGQLSEGVAGAITLDTAYPFEESLRFQIELTQAATFALTLRIPGWCKEASLHLNGQRLPDLCPAGTFVTVERLFQPGDVLELCLPMRLALQEWPRGGISVEMGPLAFVLDIQEKWRVDTGVKVTDFDERFQQAPSRGGEKEGFPNWDIRPGSTWNYALCLDANQLAEQIQIERRPVSEHPWTQSAAPLRLRVPARRIRDWKMLHLQEVKRQTVGTLENGRWEMVYSYPKGDFILTPQLPEPEKISSLLEAGEETITLVPYGCTRLRLGVFPNAKRSPSST